MHALSAAAREDVAMDMVQIKSFVKVAEEHSFTRAARQLYVATSALSRRIKDLEAELGITLLNRGYRSNELTPMGEALLPMARELVQKFEEFTRAAQESTAEGSRTILIGFPPLLDPPTLKALLEIAGNYISARTIKLRPSANAELTRYLAEHEIDLALIHEYVPTPKVDAVLLLTEEIGVVIPKGYLRGPPERVALEDLADLMYVTSENVSAPLLYKEIDLLLDQARIIHRIELPHHEMQTVMNLVVSGTAFALCPLGDRAPVNRIFAGQPVDILPLCKASIITSTYLAWNTEDLETDSTIRAIVSSVKKLYRVPAVG
jgi:DNA-binding transcriptional LysR family regulator